MVDALMEPGALPKFTEKAKLLGQKLAVTLVKWVFGHFK
jgi:hypothetical protein